jgi:hypothetical protein
VKLIQCLPTPMGPRTFVLQGLDPVIAYALADHAFMVGGEAKCMEDGQRVDMRVWLREQATMRAAVKAGKVTALKPRKFTPVQ